MELQQANQAPSHSQGNLFALIALPRQLPVYKSGPEDEPEAMPTRH